MTYQWPACRLTGQFTQVVLFWYSKLLAMVEKVQPMDEPQSMSFCVLQPYVQQLSDVVGSQVPVPEDWMHCAWQVPGLVSVLVVQGAVCGHEVGQAPNRPSGIMVSQSSPG